MASKDALSHLRHELRTPINQIIGYAEMLQEDAQDQGLEAFTQDLGKVTGAARVLLGLINDNLTNDRLPQLIAAGADDEADTSGERTGLEDLSASPSAEGAPAAATQGQILDTDSAWGTQSFTMKVKDLEAVLANSRESPAPGSGDGGTGPEGPLTLGRILVVDDSPMNRDVLQRRLAREGYAVASCENGQQALDRLAVERFDLVLLDIMMPVLDGYATLERLMADPQLRDIPVIMISALDQLDSVVRCVELGAVDYLPKPFSPTLLRARIGSCMERKRLRDKEQESFRQLQATQARLDQELRDALAYVTSLLPKPISQGEILADWRFVPSAELGGDVFSYHPIDDDHFAMFLLDVCGHGVGAALLSVSAMNVLRSQTLPDVDFKEPDQVLVALNETFQMDQQNDMYFTIWYGVYERSSRTLAYGSAGHPPAVLVTGDDAPTAQAQLLKTPGMFIGAMPGLRYKTAFARLDRYAKLFVYSDGCFELSNPEGKQMPFQAYVDQMRQPTPPGASDLDRLIAYGRKWMARDSFEDDVSLMRFELSERGG